MAFSDQRHGPPHPLRIAVPLAVLLLIGLLGHSEARAQSGGTAAAKGAAVNFLSRYARASGRIVRTDQGGDSVSAGQAYGMLISVALGERREFAAIWGWTRTHLRRPDGLLASHWRNGHVTDPKTASDADLDAARALILAAKRFHRSAYRADGVAMARAVLAHETRRLGRRLILLAGSWVRRPAIINPGYLAPRTFELLGAATHDRRFTRLEDSAIALARNLTALAPHLPPDWALVSSRGVPTPIAGPPGPSREPTPRYSLDAARLPIRFAEGCSAAARRIAAGLWPFFSTQQPGAIGFAYTLSGRLIAPQQTATMLVSAAAAAQSAGQIAARDRLLAQADSVNAQFPTYFGGAWVALGRLELQTRLLGSCT